MPWQALLRPSASAVTSTTSPMPMEPSTTDSLADMSTTESSAVASSTASSSSSSSSSQPQRRIVGIQASSSIPTPASSGAATTTASTDNDNALHAQYRAIIPLLDRFGRVLTDFSSLLWTEVDTYNPPQSRLAGLPGFGNNSNANSFEARLLSLLRERLAYSL